MVEEDDGEILEMERRAVVVESWRFLGEHALECKRHCSALLEDIVQQLRCIKVERNLEGAMVVVDKPAKVFLESEDRAVVGSLRLSECHVQDFELSIRFPRYNKGTSMHYSIVPKTTYLLRQVQDAVHSIERAADHVMLLAHRPKAGRSSENGMETRDRPMDELPDPAEELTRVAKTCSEVLRLLHEAQGSLADWSTRTLPAMPQNWVRMKPPLPPDLVMQLFADGHSVVMRVCLVTRHPRCPPAKHQACQGDSCERLKGGVLPFKGSWVEVLDATEARCPLKPFAAAITALTLARQSVRDLMHNAEALDFALAAAPAQHSNAQTLSPAN